MRTFSLQKYSFFCPKRISWASQMLINIIFISKQTKIADFHTLYIMRCRHPKETATLKKTKRHTDGIPHHCHLRAGQFKSAQPSGVRTNSVRAAPRKKPAGIADFPLHKISNATSFAGKRDTFTVSPLAQAARRQLPQRNPTVQTASRHPNLGHPPDSKPP